ncbi:hypothetical protein [Paenibacillus sp. UASWS1643]|uniref:hypothetical protein n=1 Tax=Paenibacillus sp. UASWS1643 TaxID=2580422 RepID=UPI001238DCC9|nr:hypothetical protein [Paenibacillus sp. UASWS1643]KAA8750117.1 hypothetical protein FE296_16095 [Paenibacillus sp. UASWS1643]
MNHTYRVLREDIDFFVAALSQDRVAVWHVLEDEDHLIDYGGIVEGYSPIAVNIMGKRYLRGTFEFRIKG